MTKQQIVENMSRTANIVDTKEAWAIVKKANEKMLKKDLAKGLNTLTEMLLRKRGKIK